MPLLRGSKVESAAEGVETLEGAEGVEVAMGVMGPWPRDELPATTEVAGALTDDTEADGDVAVGRDLERGRLNEGLVSVVRGHNKTQMLKKKTVVVSSCEMAEMANGRTW